MEPTLDDVKAVLAEACGFSGDRESGELLAEDIDDDAVLFDYDNSGRESLEFDSLDALEAAAMLEDRFGIQFPFEIDPKRIATPKRILEFVRELMGEQEQG